VTTGRALAALALVLPLACEGDWPAASRGDDLGPETDVPEGPLHRPGQPCTWCHGGPSPRAPVWAVAGTTYLRAADAAGLAGVTITMTDAAGIELVATSNDAGNFWLRVGSGEADDPGELRVATEPVFPLHIRIAHAGTERVMRNVIGREQSCATCHTDPPGAATVGRIFLEDPP
jgi:hypothetical protein